MIYTLVDTRDTLPLSIIFSTCISVTKSSPAAALMALILLFISTVWMREVLMKVAVCGERYWSCSDERLVH